MSLESISLYRNENLDQDLYGGSYGPNTYLAWPPLTFRQIVNTNKGFQRISAIWGGHCNYQPPLTQFQSGWKKTKQEVRFPQESSQEWTKVRSEERELPLDNTEGEEGREVEKKGEGKPMENVVLWGQPLGMLLKFLEYMSVRTCVYTFKTSPPSSRRHHTITPRQFTMKGVRALLLLSWSN